MKNRWNKFLSHPEFVQFASDSKWVFKILSKLLVLIVFLSVIFPALYILLFWVDFSSSSSQAGRTFIGPLVILFAFCGYFLYSLISIVSIFRFGKWHATILIGYNLFIAIVYLLQQINSSGYFGQDVFSDVIVYGIAISNILIAIVYYRIFKKSIKTDRSIIAHDA
ncbi:hypothetical protein EHQ64_11085 [Leptospira sarikeiensis]|uniref:DUF2569 family protein n=2 Tax=Leptospira sarikeiensis TaxID=2484943 RepID=A0A4R9K7A3_9LEPT|nr:hypothetical protein EHQ64_11085 [Leptospira sarikeiensis]